MHSFVVKLFTKVLLAGQVETGACRSTGTAGYCGGSLLLGTGFKTASENINSADV